MTKDVFKIFIGRDRIGYGVLERSVDPRRHCEGCKIICRAHWMLDVPERETIRYFVGEQYLSGSRSGVWLKPGPHGIRIESFTRSN